MRLPLAVLCVLGLMLGRAWGADPACGNHAWVHHDQYSPPDPIPVSDHALSQQQISNFLHGEQGAPDALLDPKAKIEADAFLYLARDNQSEATVFIVWYINGCARAATPFMPISIFAQRVQGN